MDRPVLVLGSASPRRRKLLAELIRPTRLVVASADLDEAAFLQTIGRHSGQEQAAALSREKARRLLEQGGLPARGLLLTADTIVDLGGKVLGKPQGKAEARAMLQSLSGQSHAVHTGLSLVDLSLPEAMVTATETTRVRFGALTPPLIDWYMNTGEPFDKAGGYGIQGPGAALVERIDGCYYNVMGLPVRRLLTLLTTPGDRHDFSSLSNELLPFSGWQKEGNEHDHTEKNDHEGTAGR